jgi:hypothetical protein
MVHLKPTTGLSPLPFKGLFSYICWFAAAWKAKETKRWNLSTFNTENRSDIRCIRAVEARFGAWSFVSTYWAFVLLFCQWQRLTDPIYSYMTSLLPVLSL